MATTGLPDLVVGMPLQFGDVAMFKWACLAVACVFLGLLAWLANDLRLEVHQSAQIVRDTGATINESLPAIVDKTRKSTDTLAEHLPEIVEKTRTTTETLAELAEDIRQLKELAGVSTPARDKNLIAYATSVLDFIDASGGTIGLKKTLGSGLKSPVPAREWAVGARKEALLLTVLSNSKKEFLTRLTRNKFRFPWYIQFGEKEPVTLLDWLKTNHPATKELTD
jgi:hypothetical protein